MLKQLLHMFCMILILMNNKDNYLMYTNIHLFKINYFSSATLEDICERVAAGAPT